MAENSTTNVALGPAVGDHTPYPNYKGVLSKEDSIFVGPALSHSTTFEISLECVHFKYIL